LFFRDIKLEKFNDIHYNKVASHKKEAAFNYSLFHLFDKKS